jgi:uncharacterized protein involved in outer membrane biogenesis
MSRVASSRRPDPVPVPDVDTAKPSAARRLGRWLGIAVLAVCLLVAGGTWWLSRQLDHDKLVTLLSAEVLRHTGRQLHVDGRLSVRLLPWPVVRLEGLRLANPAGLSRPDMLRARSVVFEVSLRPLLERRIELRRVELTGVDLLLETDARGRGNWVFTPPPGRRAEPAPAEPGTAPLTITLDQIHIDESQLAWRGSGGPAHTLSMPSVRIGRTQAGSTVDARLLLNGRALRLRGSTGTLYSVGTARPFPIDLRLEADGTQLSATGTIDHSGRRPRFDLAIQADALDLSSPKATPAAARPAGSATAPARLFSAEPWPTGTLPDADGKLQFDIARLRLAPKLELLGLRGKLVLGPGRADIDALAFQLAGGSVTGTVGLKQAGAAAPTLSIDARANGVTLEALAALAGSGGVTGGRTDLRVNLAGHARSAEQFARSLNGQFVLDAGPARLARTEGMTLVGQVVDAVKPLTAGRFDSELKCLAVRLEFAAGVASVDRTLAAQTTLADLVGSGRIDLGTETLDIALTPALRKSGATVGPALAPLVRIQGSLAAPKLAVDVAGTATTALAIGAGVAGGTLSALGQRLLGGPVDPQPCVTALKGRPAPAPAAELPRLPWIPR